MAYCGDSGEKSDSEFDEDFGKTNEKDEGVVVSSDDEVRCGIIEM
jgi:hypothetical protein